MSPPLQGIHLFNYRNFSQHSEDFQQYHTLFKGRNAVGKTNLLEAISFLCPGTGFRKDSMINFSNDSYKEDLTSIEYKFTCFLSSLKFQITGILLSISSFLELRLYS